MNTPELPKEAADYNVGARIDIGEVKEILRLTAQGLADNFVSRTTVDQVCGHFGINILCQPHFAREVRENLSSKFYVERDTLSLARSTFKSRKDDGNPMLTIEIVVDAGLVSIFIPTAQYIELIKGF